MTRSKSFNAWMARDDDGSSDVAFSLSKPTIDTGWKGVWESDNTLTRVCGNIAPRSTTFLGLRNGHKQRVRITIEIIDE